MIYQKLTTSLRAFLWPNLNQNSKKISDSWKIPDDARTGKRKEWEGLKANKMNYYSWCDFVGGNYY